MNVFQSLGVRLDVFGFEVHHLAADHAVDGSGGVSDFGDDGHACLGRALQPGEHFIGPRLQSVSREDGDGLAKRLVAGGPSAAQVVVIERGQVIVDERVGVQHLKGRAKLFHAQRNAAGNHARGLHAKDGPQALAAGEHAMPHGLMDGRGILRWRGEQPLQRFISRKPSLFECVFQHGKREYSNEEENRSVTHTEDHSTG